MPVWALIFQSLIYPTTGQVVCIATGAVPLTASGANKVVYIVVNCFSIREYPILFPSMAVTRTQLTVTVFQISATGLI
jgi:hypothetical protein